MQILSLPPTTRGRGVEIMALDVGVGAKLTAGLISVPLHIFPAATAELETVAEL